MNRPPRQLRRQTPVRRVRHRRQAAPRRLLSWRVRLILAAVVAMVASLTWAIVALVLAPTGNTSLNRFDAIIVLGRPADSEGNPTAELQARITEGVHEYERGVAPRLIVTGGPVRNQFVEARVMARIAKAQGVPESAIFTEPQAQDTIQNACYAARIAKEHGWHSAEVVTSAYHVPRVGLIFSLLPLQWRAHAAPPLEPQSSGSIRADEALETLKTVRYLLYAKWADRCIP